MNKINILDALNIAHEFIAWHKITQHPPESVSADYCIGVYECTHNQGWIILFSMLDGICSLLLGCVWKTGNRKHLNQTPKQP